MSDERKLIGRPPQRLEYRGEVKTIAEWVRVLKVAPRTWDYHRAAARREKQSPPRHRLEDDE
jgi:hypothetical protein